VRNLERLADEAIRQRRTSVAILSRQIDRSSGSGHRHIRILRTLLLDTGGESYLERRFLRLVREANLPRPTCQVVHRSDGKRIARVDFLFSGTDVVVEVTGRLGHATDAERRSDARRRNALQRAGRVVIEFTTADVLDDSDYVASTVRGWLDEP
jgi:very-short-patch-repair endonuclease